MTVTMKTALIGGIFALLGAIGGAVVTGWSQVELARQKFNSDLVLGALESSSADQRLETLRLLVETNLLKDSDVKQGVREYAKARENDPSVIPRVVPSQLFEQATRPLILRPVPFNSISAAAVYCPEGTMKYMWSEHIWGSSKIPEFPDDYFLTLGCKDAEGRKIGPWVSWYSSGAVIQRGELVDNKNGRFTSWYENGQKAYEVEKVNDMNRTIGRWLSDGTPAR